MAKQGGIFSAFRNIFRFAIWALAGVLAVALWFNWQAGEDVALAPASDDGQIEEALEAANADEVVSDVVEQQIEEATDTDMASTGDLADEVVEEIATETGDAVSPEVVEAVEESVDAASQEAADEVEEAVAQGAEAVEAAEETAGEAVEIVEDTVAAVEEGVEEAAEETIASDPTTIAIPGTDTSFTLINAFRRDNGSIEVTTEQVTGGAGATLWLVTCAPLAVGEIATGPSAGELGARTEDPEMTEIPLSDPRAMIAGTACGVMR